MPIKQGLYLPHSKDEMSKNTPYIIQYTYVI